MIKSVYFITILVSVILAGCYYDAENELYPGSTGPCNVQGTYSNEIARIIESNCLVCHNSSTPSGNVNLEGYDNIRTVSISGKLLLSVKHEGNASPMPKDGNKLKTCDIEAIEKWIQLGAPQN